MLILSPNYDRIYIILMKNDIFYEITYIVMKYRAVWAGIDNISIAQT